MTVDIYSRGMCHCSVCVPKDADVAEIESQVNEKNPTGIRSQWKVDKSAKFATGESNPHPCEHSAERLHYLMVC
jgi:hypothetical protein